MTVRLAGAPHINGPLYWEQHGKRGRPMLFVHPWPNDRSCWTYQVARFSTWFRTIAVDLPGFGDSPTADTGVTMSEYANACWAAVDEVTDEPAILVGLSVGSTIVKYMANMRPARSLALVLTGGPYYARPDAPDVLAEKPFGAVADELASGGMNRRRALLARNFSTGFRDSALGRYFLDLFTDRNANAHVPSMIEMIRALVPPDPDWLHPGVKCPVLIIMGGMEQQRSQEAHLALHAHLPNSEMRIIEGAGHCCNMEKPWEYDGHILEFLTKHGLLRRSIEQPGNEAVEG